MQPHDPQTRYYYPRRRITTTAPAAMPFLRVLLILGIAAAVVVAFYFQNGIGLFPQDAAILALGIGLATVSVVLLGLLAALRSGQRTVHHIIEAEVMQMTPEPQPEPVPAPVVARPQPKPLPSGDGEAHHAAEGRTVQVYPRVDEHNHILRLRDIEDDSAVRLNRAGVFTLADLRKAKPAALAAYTGMPQARIETWRAEAELMRVPGITAGEAALLVRHGIHSVGDLAHADPNHLSEKLASDGPVRQVQVRRRPVDRQLVDRWVENARYEQPMTV